MPFCAALQFLRPPETCRVVAHSSASHPRLRRILFIGGLFVVALLGAAYVARASLLRAYIGYRIARLHVLHPEAKPGLAEKARFYWDVVALRTQRDARAREFEPQLKPLAKLISKRQSEGKNVALSVQIYREVRWWVNFTADREMTRKRIADLQASLEAGTDQSVAQQQSESDGSWGAGYTVWFMKFYGSVNDSLAHGAVPSRPMKFLDEINAPEKLTAHLQSILRDDFMKSGVINRQELDETASGIARLLFGDVPNSYPWQPGVKEAFLKFVDDWQNPETGCFGVWFVDREGMVWKQDDVGITFHMVSDCPGKIKHLDRISRRVLQLTSVDFPAGIRMNGHYENHLNWDVVKILRDAWPQLDEQTRGEARAELSRMLQWCLAESYQPDGSFKVSDLDDTAGDAMQYGYLFLRDVGFFSKSKRFWTDEEFPRSAEIQQKVQARRAEMKLN